jgi:hypothetical protein
MSAQSIYEFVEAYDVEVLLDSVMLRSCAPEACLVCSVPRKLKASSSRGLGFPKLRDALNNYDHPLYM